MKRKVEKNQRNELDHKCANLNTMLTLSTRVVLAQPIFTRMVGSSTQTKHRFKSRISV